VDTDSPNFKVPDNLGFARCVRDRFNSNRRRRRLFVSPMRKCRIAKWWVRRDLLHSGAKSQQSRPRQADNPLQQVRKPHSPDWFSSSARIVRDRRGRAWERKTRNSVALLTFAAAFAAEPRKITL